jgi:hypothetical protein
MKVPTQVHRLAARPARPPQIRQHQTLVFKMLKTYIICVKMNKEIFGNFKCFFLNSEFSCLKPYSFLCSSGPIENMPKSLKKC